jgi:hypothetical protein
VQGIRWSAQACCTILPTSGEPVKDMKSMPGCAERGTGLMAAPRDEVDRAVGEADLDGQFGEAKGRQAGIFGRLQHDRIAHRERRR